MEWIAFLSQEQDRLDMLVDIAIGLKKDFDSARTHGERLVVVSKFNKVVKLISITFDLIPYGEDERSDIKASLYHKLKVTDLLSLDKSCLFNKVYLYLCIR